MAKDFRQNDRVVAMLPVRFEDGGVGVTRNLSPGGVYFILDESVVAGHSIRFIALNGADATDRSGCCQFSASTAFGSTLPSGFDGRTGA